MILFIKILIINQIKKVIHKYFINLNIKTMKKILTLFVLALMTVFTLSAQNAPIFSEDFSGVTGSGTQQCEASSSAFNNNTLADVLPGWSSYKAYPANGKVKVGTGSEHGWIETPAIDLSGVGSIRIVFDARAWNTNNATEGSTMTVTVNSTAYTVEGLANSGQTSDVQCDLTTFEVIAAGGGATTIRFEGTPRAFIDNIYIYAATDPTISVQGTTSFNNVSVNQACTSTLTAHGYNLTAGGTTTIAISGDTQFATTATTAANDDLMSDDGVAIPISFSAAAAGSYAATLTLTNDDYTATVALTATVITITDVPTIAALRALIDNSDVNANVTDTSAFYRYTGQGYVTQVFKTGSYTKWIQDETGAIQLYDPDAHLTNVSVDQEITNVIGHVSNYFGYTEFKVMAGIANADINAFPSSTPAPIVVTLAQLQDQEYMDGIQGQLIKLENVTFNETGTFTKQIRYTVTQNGVTDTAVYFTGQYDTQVGADIPTTACDVVGVNMRTAAYSNGYGSPRVESRYYILPKSFDNGSKLDESPYLDPRVYPNPTQGNVTLRIRTEVTHVAIYNMMGELVSSQAISNGTNTIKMSQLAQGLYFICIFNGNEMIDKVKVVRQ